MMGNISTRSAWKVIYLPLRGREPQARRWNECQDAVAADPQFVM